jgi:hypothetical protein
MEVVSQLYLALDENYITAPEFDTIANASQALDGKLVALSKSLGRQARISPPPSNAES